MSNTTIHYAANQSACKLSQDEFAREMADLIIDALSEYHSAVLEIRGYTPPYPDNYYPQGFLALCFQQADKPEASIGIEFGQKDKEALLREPFDAAAWKKENARQNGLGAYFTVINFDEAWRIICLVGQGLTVQQVNLAYGA